MTRGETGALTDLRKRFDTFEGEIRERLTAVEKDTKTLLQRDEEQVVELDGIHDAIVEDRAFRKALKYLVSLPIVGGVFVWLWNHLTGIPLPK